MPFWSGAYLFTLGEKKPLWMRKVFISFLKSLLSPVGMTHSLLFTFRETVFLQDFPKSISRTVSLGSFLPGYCYSIGRLLRLPMSFKTEIGEALYKSKGLEGISILTWGIWKVSGPCMNLNFPETEIVSAGCLIVSWSLLSVCSSVP